MAGLVKADRPAVWPDWFARGLPGWRTIEAALELPAFEDWLERDGMRIEETREDGSVVVKAEMPGIDPDKDVEITVEDGVLRIHAERKESHEESDQDKGTYRSEFRYGEYTRRIPLPVGADSSDVKATYTDGILEIRVPMAEERPVTKIPVARG